MHQQRTLFEDVDSLAPGLKTSRSGTFLDNMSLPVHRWFRYSAGFAAQWVEQTLRNWHIVPGQIVLDPFVGSGTVPVVCDGLAIRSLGIEAHPFVARICKAKTLWSTDPGRVGRFAQEVLRCADECIPDISCYAPLVHRSFVPEWLATLHQLKMAWISLKDSSPESELVWLALTSILRASSRAGTAQWQYILPNKTKKTVVHPLTAFQRQIEIIKADLRLMKTRTERSYAEILTGNARAFATSAKDNVDAVITSPPYANNYDYADAVRFEMTFWGEVAGWGDLHDVVRKYLIVSSSQHASRERLKLTELLEADVVEPIREELAAVMNQLAEVREQHGGKKHYHTMIGAYCRDIGLVLRQLRMVCKPGAPMCWVIGDSAPYGVYCPIERWIADLARAAGFKQHRFEKLRDRNIKWKNRKHRVPLKEGLLWIEG